MTTALITARPNRAQAGALVNGERPAGADLAAVVARSRGTAPAGRKTVEQRKQAFSDIQMQLRASPRISPAQALEASYAFTSLRHAQMAERQSKSAIKIYEVMEMIAERAFARISELERVVSHLTREPKPEARQTRVPIAKAKQPIRMSLVGDIRKDRVQTLVDRIKAADPDMPIRLTIDSRGGNLDSAFDLADALVRHKADVHCHALQDCSSAAVVVMLAAKKRTAEPRCHFTLHRPSLSRRPSVLADERVEGMLDNSAHSMARMLASRTGTDAEVFRPFLATARGKRLTSAEAVDLGVIHALTPHKGRKAK